MSEYHPAARLPNELLENARLLSDRYALLPLLPKGKVIAEIGVAMGDFSQNLIDICQPSRFIAIDLFDIHTHPTFWGRKPAELLDNLTHVDFYRRRFATGGGGYKSCWAIAPSKSRRWTTKALISFMSMPTIATLARRVTLRRSSPKSAQMG
jgi:hypothetical protein